MQNPYTMLAREGKARRLADYLAPRLAGGGIPVTCLSDMGPEWWVYVANAAEVKPPSAETIAQVVQMLHDRQREEQKANERQDA